MASTFLRFGSGRLDISARELDIGGRRIELPPTVFDCIAYLATHRDRAVGRDELVAAVWGKTSISDTMLGKAILAARRALGDTADAQAILRTVPRFGYRWVAATEELERSGPTATIPSNAATAEGSATAASLSLTQPAAPRAVSLPWKPITAVALVVLAFGAIATWFVHSRGRAEAPAPASSSADAPPANADAIAVLPVEVYANSGDDWLRLGLMDLLATRLRAGGVAVMPSDSVVRAIAGVKGNDEAMKRLSGAGGLRSILLPAARRSGDNWVVRVDIVDADGRRRVAQAEGRNAIAATDDASRRVLALLGRAAPGDAANVDLDLTELLQRTDAARLSENLDLARSIIAHAPANLRDLPEVRERAIRIDLRAGRFDEARAALDALLARVTAESDPVMHARLLENLCVAHLRSGRLDEARKACDESIRLLDDGNDPIALGRAYNDRGILESRQGHFDAALSDFSHSRVALTLGGDPLLMAQLDGNESTVQMAQGRPAEALPALDRAGEIFHRFGMVNETAVSVVNQIGAHLQLLQPVDALKAGNLAWVDRARITDPQVRDALEVSRADALAANGRIAEARTLLDEMLHRSQPTVDAGQAARARQVEARLDLATGEAGTAAVLARQAVDGLDQPGDEADRADAWLTLLRALRATDADSAARETAAFDAWGARSADPRVLVRVQLARAEQAAADRDATAAGAAFDTALAGTDGRTELVAAVATAYGNFLIGDGRLDDAAVVAGRVARSAEQDFDCALLQVRLYRALGREGPWRAALEHARALAGERPIPEALQALARAPG